MIVLSVSKTYWNRGVKNHRKNAKRIWLVYYLDEEDGFKLRTKRINVFEVLYYKAQIRRKRPMVCRFCNRHQYHFVNNDKELEKRKCVYEDCQSNEPHFDPEDEKLHTPEEPERTGFLAGFVALSVVTFLLLRNRGAVVAFFRQIRK